MRCHTFFVSHAFRCIFFLTGRTRGFWRLKVPRGGFAASQNDKSLRGFRYGEDLICFHVLQDLFRPARPSQFYQVDHSGSAEAEVDSLVAGGVVAQGCGRVIVLSASGSSELNFCSQAVAV